MRPKFETIYYIANKNSEKIIQEISQELTKRNVPHKITKDNGIALFENDNDTYEKIYNRIIPKYIPTTYKIVCIGPWKERFESLLEESEIPYSKNKNSDECFKYTYNKKYRIQVDELFKRILKEYMPHNIRLEQTAGK